MKELLARYQHACSLRDAWYYQAPQHLRHGARPPGSQNREPLSENEKAKEQELKLWLIDAMLSGAQVALGIFSDGSRNTVMPIPAHFIDARYIDWSRSAIRADRRSYSDVRVVEATVTRDQPARTERAAAAAEHKLNRRPSLYRYAREVMLRLIQERNDWLDIPTKYQVEEFNEMLVDRFGGDAPPAYPVVERTLHNYKTRLRKELEKIRN